MSYGEPMYIYVHTNYLQDGERLIWETWAEGETHPNDGSITFWSQGFPLMTVAKGIILNIERIPKSSIVDKLSNV